MDYELSIGVLNNFIQINNDRIKRHQTAASETKEIALKNIFDQCIITSQQCNEELSKEVTLLGGIPVIEDTATSSTFIRAWIDVEKALESKDKQILVSCSQARENSGLSEYQKILQDGSQHLSYIQQVMIEAHIQQFKADQENVKRMNSTQ